MREPEFRPGLEDVPAAKSAVSFIDGKRARLEYRGIPVETLAKESCYEETAYLLLKGDLPTQKQLAEFDHELRRRRAIHYRLKDLIKCMPPTGHPMDAHRVDSRAILERGRSADAHEGVTSFLEKRPAVFSDRVGDALPDIFPGWVEPEFD